MCTFNDDSKESYDLSDHIKVLKQIEMKTFG